VSAPVIKRGLTIPQLTARKGKVPIVSLTAYTTPMTKHLAPHVDFLLVGDSLGMVLYGMDSTLGVTLDMMIQHARAVMRGAGDTLVVVDMPFGTFEESKEVAYRNAVRIMKETGAAAVKLEGGEPMSETIEFLVKRGIPVLAHIGLMPQAVNTAGGFRSHGRTDEEAAEIMADAKAVEAAGAFAVVVEGTVEPLARKVTESIGIPTIGIGASPACDGQILVTEDMLGVFNDFQPKFVKRYADFTQDIAVAVSAYAEDVRARKFPGLEHCFGVKKEK